jgi:GT2 family glycosyltransferase/2-polyprenyl-3-methyl-5-hydroxy-6-metoxy-1,4-benzoquinol methylase/glycosyltransferase involved in cell wall biosynthesis
MSVTSPHRYQRRIDVRVEDSLVLLGRHIPRGARVLELGPAMGYFSRYLVENLDCRVDAVEQDEVMAEAARPWCEKLVLADLETIRLNEHFEDGVYDNVVLADVLEHLREPGDLMRQIPPLLKPDGQALLSVPNVAYAGLVASLLDGEFRYGEEGLLDRTHLRFYTRRSLDRLLRENGLFAWEWEGVERPLWESEFRTRLERFSPSLVSALTDRPGALFYQWIAVARAAAPPAPPREPAGARADRFPVRLFWRREGEDFSYERSRTEWAIIGRERQIVRFPFGGPSASGLRIRLADRPSFLRLYRICLRDSNDAEVWSWLPGDASLAEAARGSTEVSRHEEWWGLLLTHEESWLDLPIPPEKLEIANPTLEIELGWPMSTDFQVAASGWESAAGRLREDLQDAHRRIAERDNLLALRTEQKQERERMIEERDALLALRSGQMQEREQMIEERDALLALRTGQMQEREQMIEERDALLALRTDQMHEMERQLADKEAQLQQALQRTHQVEPRVRVRKRATAVEVIDVIVPIYNARDDVRRCVESVRRNTLSDYRLILLDDCSTDPQISAFFEELKKDGDPRLVLLRNDTNLGFVGTANRAMSLSRHDVVLLNSDTIVTLGWLEKIRRCADSDPTIGTITPFSNNAEICSFPALCKDNPLSADPEATNRAIEEAALPLYPDIPTAVGFCMYIRRALLERIGAFDERTFGRGYGEENDFSMRAAKAGYRNVLCDDTFVAHLGSRSFEASKQALTEQNMQSLLEKHPRYMEQVMSFIAKDPLRPIRDMALSRLNARNAAGRVGVLHILHGRAGGTENHIHGLIRGCDRAYRHYVLIAMDETWILEDWSGDAVITYQFEHQQDELWANLLGGLCATFGIHFCHVHHISGCREGLLQAFDSLRIPYGFTIHDFYMACPTINLLDEKGEHCGGVTDEGRCQQCLGAQAPLKTVEVARWRSEHATFLSRAAFVLAPTGWAARTFDAYFPKLKVQIVPHGVSLDRDTQEAAMCPVLLIPNDGRERIGVLGAIGPVKGARRLERLVARTRERALPLRWVVIGYTDRQFQPYQDSAKLLTVHGPYDPRDMEALLDHYRIRLVVFPSSGPETYCYTLTEAWSAGRPALVPPIGALGERMQERGAGWVMDNWQDEDAILNMIMHLIRPEGAAELSHRAELARGAPIVTLREMGSATTRAYTQALRACASVGTPPLAKQRLFDALTRARGEDPHNGRPRSLIDKWLLTSAHWALRIRYTALGRWLYRVVPVRWQRGLKNRLLSEMRGTG